MLARPLALLCVERSDEGRQVARRDMSPEYLNGVRAGRRANPASGFPRLQATAGGRGGVVVRRAGRGAAALAAASVLGGACGRRRLCHRIARDQRTVDLLFVCVGRPDPGRFLLPSLFLPCLSLSCAGAPCRSLMRPSPSLPSLYFFCTSSESFVVCALSARTLPCVCSLLGHLLGLVHEAHVGPRYRRPPPPCVVRFREYPSAHGARPLMYVKWFFIDVWRNVGARPWLTSPWSTGPVTDDGDEQRPTSAPLRPSETRASFAGCGRRPLHPRHGERSRPRVALREAV